MSKKRHSKKNKNKFPISHKKIIGTENDIQSSSQSGNQQVEKREISREYFYAGPLPPPEILAQYNQIIPNGAERIFSMAEKQSEHRQALEKTVIESGIKNSKKGLNFGLIIGLSGMAVCVICAYLKQPYPSSIIGGGTVFSLVSTFIYGSKSRKDERVKKAEIEKR
jgi:uncharacterized membrane protein